MLWDGKDLPEVGQLTDDESLNPDVTMSQSPEGYSLESNYPNPFYRIRAGDASTGSSRSFVQEKKMQLVK